MANTVIQLKYSNVTGTPPSLNLAEPAYSNVSNKLWIDDGTGVVAIGGKYYTQLIDAATAEGIANTIVRRSVDGHFNGNRVFANTINANTAVIQNGYNLYDFANAAFTQANTAIIAGGEIAGGYANSAFLKANAAYESQNTTGVYANSAFAHSNLTLQYAESGYAHANAAYSHANTKYSSSGGTISGDVAITGNLLVQGNTVSYNVSTYVVNDPIVLFANNNNSNVVDIGFAAHYVENSITKHTGLVKDVSENKYFLFDNYEPHIQEEHTLNIANPTLAVANLVANLITDTIVIRGYDPLNHANNAYAAANVADQRAVTSGSYANSAYIQANSAYVSQNTTGVYANSAFAAANVADQRAVTSGAYANSAYTHANAAFGVANTDVTNVSTTAGSYGSASVVPSFRVEANGRISSISTNSISIDAAAITSGTLGVIRGGTGNTSFTSNHVILGNGTGALTTTGSSTEGHLLTISSTGVPTFQHLSGGTF
jgi:hypothetical protein